MNWIIVLLFGFGLAVFVNSLADYLINARELHDSRFRQLRIIISCIVFPVFLVLVFTDPGKQVHFGFYIATITLSYFLLVLIIDIEHRLILHPRSIFGAVMGLGIGMYTNGFKETMLGAVVAFVVVGLLYLVGMAFNRFLQKRRGLDSEEVAFGFGDVILTTILGLILGWPNIIISIFITTLAAGIYSMGYIIVQQLFRRYSPYTPIPFAPFLILGAFLILFYPDLVLSTLWR